MTKIHYIFHRRFFSGCSQIFSLMCIFFDVIFHDMTKINYIFVEYMCAYVMFPSIAYSPIMLTFCHYFVTIFMILQYVELCHMCSPIVHFVIIYVMFFVILRVTKYVTCVLQLHFLSQCMSHFHDIMIL